MSIMIVDSNIKGYTTTRKVNPTTGRMTTSTTVTKQEVIDGEAIKFGMLGAYPFRMRGMKGLAHGVKGSLPWAALNIFPGTDWSNHVVHALNGDFCMNPTGEQKDLKEVTLIVNKTVAKMVGKGGYTAQQYLDETNNDMIIMHTNHGHKSGEFNVQQGMNIPMTMDELEAIDDVKEAETFLKSFETNPEAFSSNKLVRKYRAFNNFESIAIEEENTWNAIKANFCKGNAVKYEDRSLISYDFITLLGCFLQVPYEPALHINWCYNSNLDEGMCVLMRDPSTSKYSPRIAYNRKPLVPDWLIKEFYIPGVTYVGVEDWSENDPKHDTMKEIHRVTDLNVFLQYDCDGDHVIVSQKESIVKKVLEMNLSHPIGNELVFDEDSTAIEFYSAEGKALAEISAALGSKMGIPAKTNFQLSNAGLPAEIEQKIPEDMNVEDVEEYFSIVIEVLTWMYIDLSKHGGTSVCKTFDVMLKELMFNMQLPYAKRFDKNGLAMVRC